MLGIRGFHIGRVLFGSDRFGARNKTGFKVEQNNNKLIQDPNPNPNRFPSPGQESVLAEQETMPSLS